MVSFIVFWEVVLRLWSLSLCLGGYVERLWPLSLCLGGYVERLWPLSLCFGRLC